MMRRIIWLGDAPKSGSVYWDTKEKKAYVGESSSIISASGSQQNGAKVWIYTGIGIAIIAILGFILPYGWLQIKENPFTSVLSRVVFTIFWLFFSAIEIYLMNKFMYMDMKHLKPATPKQVQYAIESTGYLTNPNTKYGKYWIVFSFIVFVTILMQAIPISIIVGG